VVDCWKFWSQYSMLPYTIGLQISTTARLSSMKVDRLFSIPVVWRMPSSVIWCCMALVRTSMDECIASITKVKIISELGTTLTVTNNWDTLWRNTNLVVSISLPWWWRHYLPLKHRFLEEPHGICSQKTAFFTVTTIKPKILHTCFLFSIYISLEHGAELYEGILIYIVL
jgi:hypothetical protein